MTELMKKKLVNIFPYILEDCKGDACKAYIDMTDVKRIDVMINPDSNEEEKETSSVLIVDNEKKIWLKNDKETKDFLNQYFEFIDPDEKINLPVYDLELTIRSENCLKQKGIKTIKELLQHSQADLILIDGLGKKSLREIKMVLKERNLYLKEAEQ